MEMQILDNKVQGRVIDKLRENIKFGTRLSIISAYFTIYAYEELRKELGKIEKLRLLFSEPTFVKNKKDINREFKLSGSYERGLAGDRYEMKLKNELKQSEIAKECANWIREKVEVRAYDEEYPLLGKFPERLKPINIKNDIDTQNDFIDLDELNKLIRALNLAIYSPMKYILPSKIAEYSKKYDTKTGKSVFRQIDRETSLIHLMRINILKRMESSIHSFGITISKILKNIDITLEKLNKSQDIEENLDIDDLELDDPRLDSVMIGSKNVKVFIQDIDKIKWRAELEGDRAILERIMIEAFKIQPHRDKKLEELKDLIREKVKTPINEGNKKVIIFTAFADTAKYLYDNIADWGLEELGLYSAVITGSDNPKTNLKGMKGEFNNILVNFSPKSKGREATDRAEIDILIATDCISEGQNLQDCDYLINYDIHWNPVRIIQRFGRVDRIGSKNEVIQLVNFWPNMELDEYINLEARVSGRMVMLDMSATGEENVIVDSGEMNDLEYRKKQLKQLQDQVVDLEDIGGGISITDLTFNDFKMDLVNYMKNNKEILEKAPTGMYAVAKSNIEEAERGVIFCLKQINEEIKPSEFNTLNPYFLVYVKESGEVLLNFIQSKKILDIYIRKFA